MKELLEIRCHRSYQLSLRSSICGLTNMGIYIRAVRVSIFVQAQYLISSEFAEMVARLLSLQENGVWIASCGEIQQEICMVETRQAKPDFTFIPFNYPNLPHLPYIETSYRFT